MRIIIAFIFIVSLSTSLLAQPIAIIPEPVSLTWGKGTFTVRAATRITTFNSSPELTRIADYLNEKLLSTYGLKLPVVDNAENGISLSVDQKLIQSIGKEGYLLDVTSNNIRISAGSAAGIFYGVQTLLQLLPVKQKATELVVPCVSLKDYPRFPWRGMMLDVSRHFFPKEYIKKYIDQIAAYKFNRFHWHLTDDNGWRVEIKSYPKLTSVGAWRVPRVGTFNTNDPPKPGEKATDGGFYTQDDIREIVQYARERFVEILPEIDVPGHSMAAIAAYPELCVTRDTTVKVNPGTAFSTWHGNGKFTMHIDNTLNPADENVYKFLDKVFTEVAGLFPFEYIHIGGDECYKGYWERDAAVKAFMMKNKIKDGEALQGYFTKRVAEIVASKKKRVIGWDEILETPIPAGVDVMSWRGTKGGIEAAHQKRKVVMTPSPAYYLDLMQGDPAVEAPVYSSARLKLTYDHEVIPSGVDSTFILGGQGNLWTEQIPTTAQVEYMTYPRAFALAESFWSPQNKKDWSSFIGKVEKHFTRLDANEINFSPAIYDPVISVSKLNDEILITFDTEASGLEIHYTYDNTVPNKFSPVYSNAPIEFPEGADNFRVQAYRDGKAIGRLISLKTEDLLKRLKK